MKYGSLNLHAVTLTCAQNLLYNKMKNSKKRFLTTAARGSGKTLLLQKYIVDNICNTFIGVLAPTEIQFKMILEPVRDYLSNENGGIYDVYDNHSSYIFSRSKAFGDESRVCVDRFKDSFVQNYDIVLVDEASHVKQEYIDLIDKYAKKYIMVSAGWYNDIAFTKLCLNNLFSNYISIPYWMLPECFYDKSNLKEAQASMSYDSFMMDYCAAIISRDN